jgi:ATP-dependent Clp protease ATP-binding subunit ClpA
MRINVPLYITQRRSDGRSAVHARPLFFSRPEKSGRDLGRVLAGLTNDLRVLLSDVARSDSHADLLRWHQADPIQSQVTKLHLDLRESTAKLKIILVTLHRFDRRLVFSPSLSDLWFDVMPGEDVEQRASEVYESHFRPIVKENPDFQVSKISVEGKAWIDEVTIDVTPRSAPRTSTDPLRAFLGGEDVSDGAAELQKTGRCLNRVDIDQLAVPIGVDKDLRRLMRLLDGGDRRSVVLVGPPGSGKTARIEGVARMRREEKRSATEGLIWQLSPPRLISGMSYLGQWQERVLAILQHAHRRDHVLYFDDFLGLFEAGKTRDSVMCVADTLRAQLRIEPVRLLTEMTAEAWAILRERDRTLADQFVVVPTAAMDSSQSMKIMVGVRQRLEAAGDRSFEWAVLPEVVSIYDRFDRGSVLPGKAVAALYRLANRKSGMKISRSDAVTEFQSRSGLKPSIIDRNQSISRESVLDRIRTQVVGQDEPVRQLVDRVMIAAARLNDTSRPIGTFLLVGPTGVGKTQLAKAVATCLFDDGGLIRLDMNELSSPAAASRLVGTFDAPDGLLTSAVRRRPNAVLLLDEIEKAHPSVLDVLLQALGEARLSDARGRTVDLSGLLILMTSNLGARTSGRSSGCTAADDARKIRENHSKAVKEFFRPEFFNRIDGVLHFERLSADTMESIALMQFRQILQRDGLQRRNVLIDIDPDAIRLTASRGYDPAMGARALKRQIERDLISPAAKVLAETTTDRPMLLRLRRDDEAIHPHWEAIEYLHDQDSAKPLSNDQLCDQASIWIDSIEGEIQGGPLSFDLGEDGLDPEVLEKMTLRDSLMECRHSLGELNEILQQPKMQRPQSTPVESGSVPPSFRFMPPSRTHFRDLQAIDDIQDFLKESLVVSQPSDIDPLRESLINQLGRLHDQLAARGRPQRYLLWGQWFGDAIGETQSADKLVEGRNQRNKAVDHVILKKVIADWVEQSENLAVTISDTGNFAMEVSGAMAAASVVQACGSWLFIDERGQMQMGDVRMSPWRADMTMEQQYEQCLRDAIHLPVSPVRRIIQKGRPMIDLSTGAAVQIDMRAADSGQFRIGAEVGAKMLAMTRLLEKSRQSTGFLVANQSGDTEGKP